MAGTPGRATRPLQSGPASATTPMSRLKRFLVAGVLCFASAGCIGIKAHDARLWNAVEDIGERIEANLRADLSPEAIAVLARQQLLALAQNDPVGAARLLEDRLQTQSEPDGRWHWPNCLTTSASFSRADPHPRQWPDIVMQPFSPHSPSTTQPAIGPIWQSICTIALLRMIRLAQTKKARQSSSPNWRQIMETEGLGVNSSTAYLEPERIGDLRVASDYRIEGMGRIYRTGGLGVPLVAHRWTERDDSKSVQEQFFPREMRIAATAVVAPGGGLLGGEWRRKPATMQLLDPFTVNSIAVGRQQLVLATDTTTPLATQVSRARPRHTRMDRPFGIGLRAAGRGYWTLHAAAV